MELEEEINPQNLEDFKIPEVDPLKKKRIKRYIMIISAIFIIIAIIVAASLIISFLLKKDTYEINCKFYSIGNETIQIINDKTMERYDFKLSINGKKSQKAQITFLEMKENIKLDFYLKTNTIR